MAIPINSRQINSALQHIRGLLNSQHIDQLEDKVTHTLYRQYVRAINNDLYERLEPSIEAQLGKE